MGQHLKGYFFSQIKFTAFSFLVIIKNKSSSCFNKKVDITKTIKSFTLKVLLLKYT